MFMMWSLLWLLYFIISRLEKFTNGCDDEFGMFWRCIRFKYWVTTNKISIGLSNVQYKADHSLIDCLCDDEETHAISTKWFKRRSHSRCWSNSFLLGTQRQSYNFEIRVVQNYEEWSMKFWKTHRRKSALESKDTSVEGNIPFYPYIAGVGWCRSSEDVIGNLMRLLSEPKPFFDELLTLSNGLFLKSTPDYLSTGNDVVSVLSYGRNDTYQLR